MNEMKFIPGKYYKTRGGAKARFCGELLHTASDWPLRFEIKGDSCWVEFNFRKDGRYLLEVKKEIDITDEWCDHGLHITLPNGDIHCAKCNEELNVLSRLYKKHESTKDKDAHRGMACLVMNCAACESKEKPREDWVCWICKLPLYGLQAMNHKACAERFVAQRVDEYNSGKEKPIKDCRCDKDCKCDIDSDCNCWCLKEKPKKIERLYGSNEWKTLTEKCLVDTINELIDAINKLRG